MIPRFIAPLGGASSSRAIRPAVAPPSDEPVRTPSHSRTAHGPNANRARRAYAEIGHLRQAPMAYRRIAIAIMSNLVCAGFTCSLLAMSCSGLRPEKEACAPYAASIFLAHCVCIQSAAACAFAAAAKMARVSLHITVSPLNTSVTRARVAEPACRFFWGDRERGEWGSQNSQGRALAARVGGAP
jgi:hypothetical protein